MDIYFLLIITGLLGIAYSKETASTTDNVCAPFLKKCSCFKSEEYEVQCPSTKPDLLLRLIPDKYINIDCFDPKKYTLDILPDMNLNVDSLKMRFCKLPSQFNTVLEKLNVTQLNHLTLNQCELGNASLTHTEEDLWNNNLSFTIEDYFVGLRKLKTMELSGISIISIGEKSFSEFTELVNISLELNKLNKVFSNTFRSNLKLENIRLDNNPNLILEDYVFANLTNLKMITLNECNLKDVKEHIFENDINLRLLNLQYNKLQTLPQGIFNSLTKLQNLNLSNNQLASLPGQLFSALQNLIDLDLGYNHLTVIGNEMFDNLNNLKNLILHRNMIFKIDVNAFAYQTNLIKIDLSFNHLNQHENVFSYLLKCEQLLLSHNRFTEFPDNILNSFVNFRELDLSYNNIKEIIVISFVTVSHNNVKVNLTHNNISTVDFTWAERVAQENFQKNDYSVLNKSTEIDITGNPLACDCQNFELIQYLNLKLDPVVRSLAEIIVKNTTCFNPKDFRHIPISSLHPENITCELNLKDCPSKCQCYMRPVDSTLLVDCSFKNLTDSPDIFLKEYDRIEVNLFGNSLENGPSELQGYENVTNLYINNNKLKSFDYCPPKINKLKLDHNQLHHLNSNVLKTLIMSKKFSSLTLANNSWACGCSAFELQNFIKSHLNQTKVNDVICADDKTPLVNKKELCKSKAVIVAQIVIPILIFFFIIATATALYFRYKKQIMIWLFSKNWCLWFITEEELDKDKKYDIFVSFSHKDEDFVIEKLIQPLEKNNFKLCVHSRDWVPGELISEQIVESVYNSRRTLVVLSDNFLESAWGKLEFLMAHKRSIEDGRPRVILVKLADLTPEKICQDFEAYMKTNTYIEWGDSWFWKKLLYALPHSNKNFPDSHQKHTNMMLKIDDKFDLVSLPISYHDSTPPAICLESIQLKNDTLNTFGSELPLIKST